ncbi:universal stress protein [Halalkalibacterium halodurans]|uniref:Universal stress protein n=2 Tax=Halalkalibacterium halodurans TaxID=86665 RepID=A0A0M0KGW5_ALKHA|nr:universal stress protein [Halalkalibacterium halodurans]TPE69886.1 universal stress protein [Halalkalibacterium halodurans]
MSSMYNHILVAVDGSPQAKRALYKAFNYAKEFKADLFICHVIDSRSFATVEQYDRTVVGSAELDGKKLLQRYSEEAEKAGVDKVHTILDFGSPKANISKTIAQKYDIDLIITGATGLNAVERFLMGSVSESVARHAKCDVLIVRNDQDQS